jgi:hypothetical protein
MHQSWLISQRFLCRYDRLSPGFFNQVLLPDFFNRIGPKRTLEAGAICPGNRKTDAVSYRTMRRKLMAACASGFAANLKKSTFRRINTC